MTREQMMVAECVERVVKASPRLTAELAIAKLRSFASARDLIVAAPRTNARDWYALNAAMSVDDDEDTGPKTLRSGAL